MDNMKFTTIDRVFAKLGRDLRGTDLHETDIIEWIGECMEEFRISGIVEQAVCFSEVKHNEALMPEHLNHVLQIAKYNYYEEENNTCIIPKEVIEEVTKECAENLSNCYTEPLDGNGKPIFDDYAPAYIPKFDMQWQYIPWNSSPYYLNSFTPVRLANSTFFNTIVCKEKNQQVYENCSDQYTIIEGLERKFRFSFQTGYVAIAYTRTRLDPKTGYPLVPDDKTFLDAITYYIKWKIMEREEWRGRQGASRLAQDNERKWVKYCSQAKSKIKMPQTLDDYQDLLESSFDMIPDHNKYYGFYGGLGQKQDRQYADPDSRNRRFFIRSHGG